MPSAPARLGQDPHPRRLCSPQPHTGSHPRVPESCLLSHFSGGPWGMGARFLTSPASPQLFSPIFRSATCRSLQKRREGDAGLAVFPGPRVLNGAPMALRGRTAASGRWGCQLGHRNQNPPLEREVFQYSKGKLGGGTPKADKALLPNSRAGMVPLTETLGSRKPGGSAPGAHPWALEPLRGDAQLETTSCLPRAPLLGAGERVGGRGGSVSLLGGWPAVGGWHPEPLRFQRPD